MPEDPKKEGKAVDSAADEADEGGVPIKNRLEELKRKNKKLEDAMEVGVKELTAMRQELDSFKQLQAEIKTLKERQDSFKQPAESTSEIDSAFFSSPYETTKKVMSETLAKEFLPQIREVIKAEVSGIRGELNVKEQAAVSNAKALNEYPALQDQESEFYQETANEVKRLSEKPGLKNDPELILLASQLVAARRPDLAKKAKDEYVSPYAGSAFESGGVSPRKRISKAAGPSANDKKMAEEFNTIMQDLGIKIKPEDVDRQRKEAIRMNPKLKLHLEEN